MRYPVLRSMLFLLLILAGGMMAISADNERRITLLDIRGPIGPAVADYLQRGIAAAEHAGDEAVILRLDTPGGLDASMRDIIRDILASELPVIAWVAPNGARAASAGTFILYAAHVAAMTPVSSLGAATPVRIGGLPGTPEPPATPQPEAKKKQAQQEQEPKPAADAMERKVTNDAVAYIRGLADMRGRNADWAEKAVREAASLSAKDALKMEAIDLIAADMKELLAKVDGRTVKTAVGEKTLHTAGADIVVIQPDWRSELLAIITDPNIAYLLMLLGFYGIFFELANPGYILPGVVGAICLLLALFAFQVLPINYAGLALIVLGIAFMVAEVFVASFGALGIGGLVAFVVGSIILIDTDAPGFGLSIDLVAALGLTSLLFFVVVASMALKSRQRPVVTGREEMIGLSGEAVDNFTDGRGRIHVHGEIWQAECDHPVAAGQPLHITGMHGLTLQVEHLSITEESS